MYRRHLLARFALGCGLGFCLPPALAVDIPTLDDTLRFGLRARRPIEIQFVAAVAKLTNDGRLPLDYVLASFDYARNRRPHIPLPYFEFVVRKKAEELGVDIGVPNTLENN